MTLQHKKVSRQIMLGVSTAPWKCCCRILFFSIIENMIANMEVELWTEIVYLVNYPGFEISEFGFSVLKICVCHQFDEKCIVIGIQTLLIFILVKFRFHDYNFLSVSYFNLSFDWNLTSCFTNSIECNYIQAQDFWFTAASIFRSILWKKGLHIGKSDLMINLEHSMPEALNWNGTNMFERMEMVLHVNTQIDWFQVAPQIFLLIDTLYDAPCNKLLRLWKQILNNQSLTIQNWYEFHSQWNIPLNNELLTYLKKQKQIAPMFKLRANIYLFWCWYDIIHFKRRYKYRNFRVYAFLVN